MPFDSVGSLRTTLLLRTTCIPHTLPSYPRPQHPPCRLSQATTNGRGLPPSIMVARRRHLRSARGSADLVDLVLTVPFSMHRQDLTPILPPTHHPCMQPPSTTHSHPPHGMSANLIKLCSQSVPLRVLRTPVRESALPECELPTLAFYQ